MTDRDAARRQLVLVQYPGLSRRTTLSPPCAKVHMALRFKGLDYAVRNVRLPRQVKAYNPRGRVPVLLLDGEVVVDSTDILTELDRRFPRPALEPVEPRERARVKILEDWADEALYFYGVYLRWCVPENFARLQSEVLARLPVPVRWLAPWIARREVRARVRGQGVGLKDRAVVEREFDACLEALEQLLASASFLVGATLTRADLAVCAVLDQMALERLSPGAASAIAARRAVNAWRARVHAAAPDAARP